MGSRDEGRRHPDDPLREVEQYPRAGDVREVWPPARRAAYLQALEELQAAGRLSRKEFEKTMIERADAEAADGGRRQSRRRDDHRSFPRPGRPGPTFPLYGDGAAPATDAEPREGWR